MSSVQLSKTSPGRVTENCSLLVTVHLASLHMCQASLALLPVAHPAMLSNRMIISFIKRGVRGLPTSSEGVSDQNWLRSISTFPWHGRNECIHRGQWLWRVSRLFRPYQWRQAKYYYFSGICTSIKDAQFTVLELNDALSQLNRFLASWWYTSFN